MNKTPLFFFLFAVSGFSGLMYESVWSHYLKLFLGHAAYAQTLVLVIYMGGMAVGSYAAARLGGKIKNVLLFYAGCEALIGLMALAFHPAFALVLDFSYRCVIPLLHSEFGLSAYKWMLSAALILPQSVLLGCTFPLMSAGIIRKIPRDPGKTIAMLYFTNSIGGAVGVLACGYLFISIAGYPGAIVAAGAINVLLAAVVLYLAGQTFIGKDFALPLSPLKGRDPLSESSQARHVWDGKEGQGQGGVLSHGSKRIWMVFLSIAALTGALSFMYEIGWIRMLGLVLGSYTHAFELMLSAFVLGLALGSFFIRRKIDSLGNSATALSIVQLVMGACALLTIVGYNGTFDLMHALLNAIGGMKSRFFFLQLSSQSVAYCIMLPTTVCAGMTLPLITYHLLGKGFGEKAIGNVYAANTIGAILGVLASVQIIMPEFGLKNLILAGGAIDLSIGIYLMPRFNKKLRFAAVCAAVALIAFCAFVSFDSAKMAAQVFTEAPWNNDNKVEFHKDGKTASVDVVRYGNDGSRGICTNGMNVGTIAKQPNVITQNATLLAALPLSMMINPRTVATFGVGTGFNARVFLSDSSVRNVDIIEIEKNMYDGSRLLGDWVDGVYGDPRCNRYVEDARSFFAWKNKRYDIVVADISYVWVSGVAGLFSREFYAMMRSHIALDGLLVQWMHSTSMELLASIIKALSASFTDYSIFYAGNFLIIVAGENASFERIDASIFRNSGLGRFLHENAIDGLCDMRFHYLGSKQSLDPLFASYPIASNSDYYPVLDLGAFKASIEGRADCFDRLFSMRFMKLPLIDMLENYTAAGYSAYVSSNQQAQAAKWMHDFCIAKGDTAHVGRAVHDEDRANALIIKGADAWNVTDADGVQKAVQWLTSLNEIMKTCMPVLSHDEIADILMFAGSRFGGRSLFPDMEKSLALYKAINDRNYDTCLSVAMQYLSQSNDVSAHETFFLPLAMVSAIKLGRPEMVNQLWKRYENRANPETAVRLLHEIAKK